MRPNALPADELMYRCPAKDRQRQCKTLPPLVVRHILDDTDGRDAPRLGSTDVPSSSAFSLQKTLPPGHFE